MKEKISDTIITSHVLPEVTTLSAPTKFKGGVYLSLSLLGGSNFNKNPLIPVLATALLEEGTKKHTKQRIHEKLDTLGVDVTFSCHGDRIAVDIAGLSESIPAALPLVRDMLLLPRMSPGAIAAVRERVVGSLLHAESDTYGRARTELRRLLYRRGHPNFLETPREQIEFLRGIERNDLLKHHHKIGTAGGFLIAGGDLRKSDAEKYTRKIFENLGSGAGKREKVSEPYKNRATEEVLRIPGKASVDVILAGKTHIKQSDPLYPALVIALSILSGGFKPGDRLLGTLREKESLTYHVRAGLDGFADEADGYWYAHASFAPSLYERGTRRLREEVLKFIENGPTEEEVRRHKERYVTKYFIALSKTENLTDVILRAVEEGHAPEYIDAWIAKISALTRKDITSAIKKCMGAGTLAGVSAGSL